MEIKSTDLQGSSLFFLKRILKKITQTQKIKLTIEVTVALRESVDQDEIYTI